MTSQYPQSEPQILPPRRGGSGPLFGDENLDILSHLLDDCFRIPGTNIRFGLDGIIGFIPGLGDILAGLASCIIVVAAWFRGVPYVTLLRMLANLAIEVLVGIVPFLGNIFDIAWKANRRNYKLLTRHLEEPRKHTWRDWGVLLMMLLVLIAMLLTPVIITAWLAEYLWHKR